VLDKVLNDYTLSHRMMTARATKVIFLLREPRAGLKSIIAMGRNHAGMDWHRDPRTVLAYYLARLSRLEESGTDRDALGAHRRDRGRR
jgi:hypothetical protein